MNWDDFLYGAKEVTYLTISLRAIVLYLVLIFATRLMRQRQISILAGHNYIVAAGIVSIAVIRMIDPESSLISGIVIILIYALINIFLSYIELKMPRKVDHHGTILIENGKIIKENMLDARITIDNLLGQLRIKNVFNLSDVSLAIVEATGKINVLKKENHLPITKNQMKIPIKNTNLPFVLVYDGKIQKENIKNLGYDTTWLDNKIKEQGFQGAKDIFLAMIEGNGSIYISV